MSSEIWYTQEQLDIALLKNTQEGILREIQSQRTDMTDLSSNIRVEMHSMRDEIKSQGHWNVGLILGIYGMIGAAALAKLCGIL